MRRIKPEFIFDIWIPALAPSTELLKKYHEKKITWNEYEVLFKNGVLKTQHKYLKILLDIAKENIVTLLCWEEIPEKCHRRLVAEKLKTIQPKLKITLL